MTTTQQSKDGTAHFTYYDIVNTLSYVWNGESSHIEVSLGGYGKPVTDTILVSSFGSIAEMDAIGWLHWFRQICANYSRDYEANL